MSRSYNARRKARRKARTEFDGPLGAPRTGFHNLLLLAPVAAIAAILATVAVLGFGGGRRISHRQIQGEVAALLSGIPQHGATLGEPDAPLTLSVYADLECGTVRQFIEVYLPSIIETWVRNGTLKIRYQSLKTDTSNEQVFFTQEAAALAAGKQNKMWNFVLIFIKEQEKDRRNYGSPHFLTRIADQVPGLRKPRWRRNSADPLLERKVASEVHSAHARALLFTPSFLLSSRRTDRGQLASLAAESARAELRVSLGETVETLVAESSSDVPALEVTGSQK